MNVDYGGDRADDEVVNVSIGVRNESLHEQFVDAFYRFQAMD